MTDPIESAEAFASRLSDLMCISHGDNFVWAGPNVAAAILARDAAVRREALREAADWLARCVPDEPTERDEWQQVLVEAADSLCAIADGAPKDAGAVRWPLRALAGGSDVR